MTLVGRPGLEVTPGREFYEAANNGQPFLKNWDKFTQPSDEELTFHAMPPTPGAITVNIGELYPNYKNNCTLADHTSRKLPNYFHSSGVHALKLLVCGKQLAHTATFRHSAPD